MDEFRALMDRFWVTRAEDKELYFLLKRTLPDYRRFIQEQLGWSWSSVVECMLSTCKSLSLFIAQKIHK